MPIEQFYARSETYVVTFSLRTIAFSASLVKDNGLAEYEGARIGIDEELRRIYFGFEKQQTPGLARFYRQTGRSSRKMIACGALYSQYDWIGALQHEKDKAKKQFVLEEINPSDTNLYTQYQFYITLGYSWSADRNFQDPALYPKEPGVYRLKRAGEIVRIGQGKNMADRLEEHIQTYGSEIDSFDFEIVPDEQERKREEKRLLEAFKSAVGRLPEYNPITS